LACGDLALLHQAVTEPMSVERFLRNLWLAGRLTALRLPSESAAAEAAFCGPA
jgi:hypothetical protein